MRGIRGWTELAYSPEHRKVRARILNKVRIRLGRTRRSDVNVLFRPKILVLRRVCNILGLGLGNRRDSYRAPARNAPDKRVRSLKVEGQGSPVPTWWKGKTVDTARRVFNRREASRRPWAEFGS